MRTLFISNLTITGSTTRLKKDLEALFNKYGKILNIYIKKTKSPVGVAWLQFETEGQCKLACLKLNRKLVRKRNIKIQLAKSETNNKFINDCECTSANKRSYSSL